MSISYYRQRYSFTLSDLPELAVCWLFSANAQAGDYKETDFVHCSVLHWKENMKNMSSCHSCCSQNIRNRIMLLAFAIIINQSFFSVN